MICLIHYVNIIEASSKGNCDSHHKRLNIQAKNYTNEEISKKHCSLNDEYPPLNVLKYPGLHHHSHTLSIFKATIIKPLSSMRNHTHNKNYYYGYNYSFCHKQMHNFSLIRISNGQDHLNNIVIILRS